MDLDQTNKSIEYDGTLTRYESLHMGHFKKMMSEDRAKDTAGKIVNSELLVEIVKNIFPFIKKIGKGINESIEWSVSILDTSEDGFQKLKNEPNNHVEGKEAHSESDSEFDTLFNQFRKPRVENDPTQVEEDLGEVEVCIEDLEDHTQSESETDYEQFDENLDKLINATRTEHRGYNSAGKFNNSYTFLKI